jgi:DNA-binding MarR family transcriptional regulator
MVLRLTARGNALLKDTHTAVRAQLAEVLKGLSGAELATLHDTLGLLQRSFPEMPAAILSEMNPLRKP